MGSEYASYLSCTNFCSLINVKYCGFQPSQYNFPNLIFSGFSDLCTGEDM